MTSMNRGEKQQLHAWQSFVVQQENLNSMKRSSLNTPELYNHLSFICQSAHEMSCHRHLTISRDQLQCLRGDKKATLVGGLFHVRTTERKKVLRCGPWRMQQRALMMLHCQVEDLLKDVFQHKTWKPKKGFLVTLRSQNVTNIKGAKIC